MRPLPPWKRLIFLLSRNQRYDTGWETSMSYRSFKEILGETSLERKCRFLFGLCLLLLITGSFWWYGSRTEDLVFTSTRTTGRHLVDAVMLHHHWKTL